MLVDGRMTIFYTQEALRDLLEERVMLSTGSPSISRPDEGLDVPLPLYLIRGLRCLTEGTAKTIWLPQRHIEMLKREAYDPEYDNGEGKPKGRQFHPLLAYIIPLICERYDEIKEYQENVMLILKHLGLAQEGESFNYFRGRMETEYSLKHGKGYELRTRSVEEVFTALLEAKKGQEEKRQTKSQERENCTHQWERKELEGINKGFVRDRCPLCGKFRFKKPGFEKDSLRKANAQEVPSNAILIRSKIRLLPREEFLHIDELLGKKPISPQKIQNK
jgi:hypothetical protein